MKKNQERKDHIISRKVITPWTRAKTDNRKDHLAQLRHHHPATEEGG